MTDITERLRPGTAAEDRRVPLRGPQDRPRQLPRFRQLPQGEHARLPAIPRAKGLAGVGDGNRTQGDIGRARVLPPAFSFLARTGLPARRRLHAGPAGRSTAPVTHRGQRRSKGLTFFRTSFRHSRSHATEPVAAPVRKPPRSERRPALHPRLGCGRRVKKRPKPPRAAGGAGENPGGA